MESLKEYFDKIITVDVNENCDTSVKSVDDLEIQADVIASYFVMEHIGNVDDMLKRCYRNLKDDGILLIEVPDIEAYVKDPVALEVLEHVNHFSPISLINMCRHQGFRVVYFSRENASRSYGFVAAFVKGNMSLEDAIIFINEASMKEGLEKVEKIRPKNIEKMALTVKAKGTALWCANDMCKEFLQQYELRFGKYDGLIIDENPKKKNFIQGTTVYTSSQASEALQDCNRIIIFSDVRKEVIFKRIKEIVNSDICVEYIDNWFEAHRLQ